MSLSRVCAPYFLELSFIAYPVHIRLRCAGRTAATLDIAATTGRNRV